ncbi:hypothetical protein ABOM_000392 [Aspergillus bombycis]|uniref:Tachykinin family protein n=1 Tax=Aspergillus bombycis TaxID=109264 RepID=A0A1F8AHK5_9EURO|nr:hypothetical protein ABOM_000392 [Aspergillus bombycis]OGM51167.1 hypothetical protein ABOM_000392 [Aspergillus bombycis]
MQGLESGRHGLPDVSSGSIELHYLMFVPNPSQEGPMSHAMREHWKHRRRKEDKKIERSRAGPLLRPVEPQDNNNGCDRQMDNHRENAPNATARPKELQIMFVPNFSNQGVRSHAMRAHWKHRRRKGQKKIERPEPRPLLPHMILQDRDNGHDTETDDRQGKVPGAVEAAQPCPYSVPENQEVDLGTHAQCLIQNDTLGQNPGNSWDIGWNLDPFHLFPVHLTSSQKRIFHHWLNVHTILRLGDWPIADCINDVWIPLVFSNVSAFNTLLACSAAHLSSLNEAIQPTEALMFKAQAMRIINLWLGDPVQALEDKTFLAVSKIITFERRWGSEYEWNIHHDGLQKMLFLRGGLSTFDGNKPLKHFLSLILLLARPSWFGCTNFLPRVIVHPIWPILESSGWEIADVNTPRDLWLYTLTQEISTLSVLEGCDSYTALPAVVLLLRRSAQEDSQLSTNFVYISCLIVLIIIICDVKVAKEGYRATQPLDGDFDDLLPLDRFLESERHTWYDSIAGLHAVFFGSSRDISIFLQRSYWVETEDIFGGHWNANARIGFVGLLLSNLNRVMGL